MSSADIEEEAFQRLLKRTPKVKKDAPVIKKKPSANQPATPVMKKPAGPSKFQLESNMLRGTVKFEAFAENVGM